MNPTQHRQCAGGRRPGRHIDPDRMWALHARCADEGPEVAAWFHRQRAHYWWDEAGRRHWQWQREQLAARLATDTPPDQAGVARVNSDNKTARPGGTSLRSLRRVGSPTTHEHE